MRAEDLRLNELVDFSEGNLNLQGRRLVLHDLRAFAQFRKDLLEMVGREDTRRILTRFGYFWGQADAAAMKRLFQWDNTMEWIKAGSRMHALHGVAKSVVKTLKYQPDTGAFMIEFVWHNSGEAEEHLAELGPSDHPICWMLCGYAGGYCSFCLNQDIYFIEKKCRAQGDRTCMALGKDRISWGEEIKPFLPYFQATDIQGKIQRLTQQLREKSRELTAERRKLERLEYTPLPSLIEVRSESFRRVLDLANRVAPFESSILITGESGTGKEVLARYIHKRSSRAKKNFVAINCGALPETLLESELFGHKAGSFTGAVNDRIGLFEQAHQGTLFLDEIGDITPGMQIKLLRVLQEKEILRVGENRPRKIDVRVIAATNRNLVQAVREGRYREDLYYRLGVIEIEVPPLRERKEDILPLCRYFVAQFAKKLNLPKLHLDAACVDYLQSYSWPGNVRELENAVERAAVLSRDGLILPDYLPQPVLNANSISSHDPHALCRTLAEVEKEQIETVLEMTKGNRSQAAKILGIGSATLWRKMKNLQDKIVEKAG